MVSRSFYESSANEHLGFDRPAIGGAFSNPAEEWPNVFGESRVFKEYPYLLPCLVAAAFPIAAFLLALIALREVTIVIL